MISSIEADRRHLLEVQRKGGELFWKFYDQTKRHWSDVIPLQIAEDGPNGLSVGWSMYHEGYANRYWRHPDIVLCIYLKPHNLGIDRIPRFCDPLRDDFLGFEAIRQIIYLNLLHGAIRLDP